MNLQIKEFNCEKAGFRAIHTENDADRLISCRRIINDAKDFSTHQWNFLASIALSLRVISRFKGFLRLINLEISIFLEQIFTSGIILNETAKTKSVKFIYCTLKERCGTLVNFFDSYNLIIFEYFLPTSPWFVLRMLLNELLSGWHANQLALNGYFRPRRLQSRQWLKSISRVA